LTKKQIKKLKDEVTPEMIKNDRRPGKSESAKSVYNKAKITNNKKKIRMNALIRRIKILMKSIRVRRFLSEAPKEQDNNDPNIILVKTNYIRAPRFRINTVIKEKDGKKSVIKKAATPEAESFLDHIERGRQMLKGIYNQIEVIDCRRTDEGLDFDFIDGQDLLEKIDPNTDPIDKIRKAIDETFAVIFDIKEDPKPFEETEQFRRNFPGIHPGGKEQSYSVTNLDSNLDNFKRQGDRIFCFDYEWVEDYPIPVRFVKFRALLRYYVQNKEALCNRISRKAFISMFGYTGKDIRMFTAMEESFQLYIEDLGSKGSRF